MGAYAPAPVPYPADELCARFIQPVLDHLAAAGTPYVGVLYAGLMLTADGPRLLEFNCRFGDPETQSIVPRLEGDELVALAAAAAGDASRVSLTESDDAAVTLVVVGADYPATTDVGTRIDGIAEAEASGALVFHAGTALRDDRVVTNGGRILNVTATGPTIAAARERAYDAATHISFEGSRYRTDIAKEAASLV
jgi:phosphoribosylamine--glycine ligase